MKLNKCTLILFAVAILAAPDPLLHASDLIPTLTVNGTTVTLVDTTVGGLQEFSYSDLSINLSNTRTTTFLATYGTVGGVDVLNVTNACAQVTVLGNPVPCETLAFTFTDLDNQNVSLVSALGTAGASVSGDVANIQFDASVGGGSSVFDFSPAATPEPGSLSLLGTGILGVGAAVRRRRVSLG